MKALTAPITCLAISLLSGTPVQSQAFTFFGMPWGISQAAVNVRLNSAGIIPVQDHGNGRIEYLADSSRIFASFDGDRLVGIQENYELAVPADAMRLFQTLEDSLRRAIGPVDSVGLQLRIWKRPRTGERLHLSMYIPSPASDSTSPAVYLSREGPGYSAFWDRFIGNMVAEMRNELYGWIYERAPADRWELVYSQDDRGVLYERALARRTAAGTWRVWIRTVLRDTVSTRYGVRYDLMMSESEIDCAGRRTRSYETVLYLGSNVVDSEGMTGWSRWLPETVGEGMYEGFCRRVRGRH